MSGLLSHNPLLPKAVFISCGALLGAGAVFLVAFALMAPELPPDNMVSALNRAGYVSEQFPSDRVVLPTEDNDWAVLSAWDDRRGEQTGAGTAETDRTVDFEYSIRPKETLSEIAYAYAIPLEVLAYYNRITNPNRIREGTVIKIPSLDNQKAAAQQMARQPPRRASAAAGTRAARISCETRANGDVAGAGVTVHFSIADPPVETLQSFEWDFGDGKRGFRADPIYEYTVPKTYVVRLTARDAQGVIYRSNPVYIDVPHPGSAAEYSTTKFITLSSPDDFFVVNGAITAVARYPSVEEAPLDFSESDQYLTKVRFTKPGFYGITVNEASHPEQCYSVFVSPIPTMHADSAQESFNWYRTQFNTGTTSNCGPASASMAIGWSLGKYFSVSSVRQFIGWQGDGGTSLEELLRVIKAQGVPATLSPVQNVQSIKDVIDSGSIAVVLFHTDGVKTARQDPAQDLFGKYYNDSVGHYIVIKGYSLNGEYLVTYDPIPSDWGSNSFRYGDDVSMIGRNRYYSSAELLRSLRRADMIVVPREK
ncbi:MAG: LysM peptidoglycan-binding domain-containing protein [Treponema sp.]|nr:LysM peptidoglycan-binding domain-containing protein [Treponema sp.]